MKRKRKEVCKYQKPLKPENTDFNNNCVTFYAKDVFTVRKVDNAINYPDGVNVPEKSSEDLNLFDLNSKSRIKIDTPSQIQVKI